MRIAVSGQLLGKTWPLPRILETIRSLGVDAVELWPENLGGGDTPEWQGRYERKDVPTAQRALQEAGLAVACVTLSARAMQRCHEDGPADGTAALKGAVDTAATLGAPLVNCYLAGLPPALFVDVAQPAAEYAGTLGITIVLENEAHDDSGTAQGVREIIEAVGSPHFGTAFDPCNYYQAHDEPFPRAYEVVRDVIRYVHLKGGCRYDEHSRFDLHRGGTMRGQDDQFIGYGSIPDGVVNADGLIRRLRDDGYAGFIAIEPHVPVDHALAFYQIDVPYVQARIS